MKKFGGSALFLGRNDINTDEIIPAKYLTENSKLALKPYILEDLKLTGFDPKTDIKDKRAIVTQANFGCGSSREHAVWVFEVNDINVVIGESFARIFRQNMFNCGMLAIELDREEINSILALSGPVMIDIDLDNNKLTARGDRDLIFSFKLNPYDRDLVMAGGWLAYADKKY